MSMKRILTLMTLTACAVLAATALPAAAQQSGEGFSAADFEYGSRFEMPDGTQAEIWNPAKRKLIAGGPMIGGTRPSPGNRSPASGAPVRALPPQASAWPTRMSEKYNTQPTWAQQSSSSQRSIV